MTAWRKTVAAHTRSWSCACLTEKYAERWTDGMIEESDRLDRCELSLGG